MQYLQLQYGPLPQYNLRTFTKKEEKGAEEGSKDEKKTQEKSGKEEEKEATKEKADKKVDEKKKADQKKQEDQSSSSSSDDEGTDATLSAEDIKKIKQLIADQDKEIDTLKEQVKTFKEKLVYQLAENENTIKRYRKEIETTKDFAITKFAKELLEVRDSLDFAKDHINKIQITEETS